MRVEPNGKRGGGDELRCPSDIDDLVDEASAESFPCSDPPAFTSMHAGAPLAIVATVASERLARAPSPGFGDAGSRRLAFAQGAFFVATGLWPIVHLRSFEAVTGPKREAWLVKTVGLLVTAIGASLLAASRRRIGTPAALVGAGSAAALAGVDLVYVARRRIAPVYLIDAFVELLFVCGWTARIGSRRRANARSAP